MWKWIINRRLRVTAQRSAPITSNEADRAAHVLFTVFARYGDSIIAFKAIAEFIGRYPGKRYTVVTTHQARPYAKALLPDRVRIYSINKRRNPLGMFNLVQALRHNHPDIGLNPWSHGEESEYFISFARRFHFYRDFADFSREVNLYARARRYLNMPASTHKQILLPGKHAESIVIAPFSTDVRKSLTGHDLELLLKAIKDRFNPKKVTIAAMPDEIGRIDHLDAEKFTFHKSAASSENYLALLGQTNLFIGVDAGPLHVAMALDMPTIGLFGPTAPETIIDSTHQVLALRAAELDGVFCDVLSCTNPVCIHKLCADINIEAPATIDRDKSPKLENKVCRVISS